MINHQLLFSPSEAARLLGLETSKVKALVATGRLGCYKFGHRHDAPYRIGKMHIGEYQRDHS